MPRGRRAVRSAGDQTEVYRGARGCGSMAGLSGFSPVGDAMSVTATQTNTAERRIAPRFQPAFGTICRLRPLGRPEPAVVGLVWNISETGVSMLIADPPARGSEFDAELTTEGGAEGLRLTIRVVHVREMPVGDFFAGAQFGRPLTPDELRRFLLPLPAPANPPTPANA